MKVICTQENLKRGLNATSRISSGSTTLPVLNNILLKTEDGSLKLSCTNLEMGINTWVRCKVEEEGGLSVPAKTFSDLVNNLPNDNITLTIENNQLLIETSGYSTKIKGLAPDEFPLIPQIDGEQEPIEISAKDLKTAIAQVAFSVAYSETQPEISGILFNFDEKSLTLVATDRYRLAEKRIEIKSNLVKSLIIPNRAVQELSKTLANVEKDSVNIYFTQNQVMFKTLDTEIVTRLIDGQYPDYKQIIPQNFNTELHVSVEQLASAMRTAGIFTQTGNNVSLEYASPDHLQINSQSGDVGESKVNVPCTVDGSNGRIIFNHRYILDCLNAITSDNVTFRLIDENSPAVLVSKDAPGYTYLVMPIKI
jgi:DNA polymerase-3 subunit beta